MLAKAVFGWRDNHLAFRQGDIIELWYGIGTGAQRVFYGFIPGEGTDRNISPDDSTVRFTAYDFIGQLQSYSMTLGASDSSFLCVANDEIGGAVSTIVETVIDAQYRETALQADGIQGTNPTQTVPEADAPTGPGTAKSFIDTLTALAYDDSAYPNPPLVYEYHQRDNRFIWRKQRSLTSSPAMRLTVGKDAILSGKIDKQPVYSDALVTGRSGARWYHSDRDTSRRWGGRRLSVSAQIQSDALSDIYDAAVRLVESNKSERSAFSLTMLRDPFLLYPGDVIDVRAGEPWGLVGGAYRVQEVSITLGPNPRTTVTVDASGNVLTDYL